MESMGAKDLVILSRWGADMALSAASLDCDESTATTGALATKPW